MSETLTQTTPFVNRLLAWTKAHTSDIMAYAGLALCLVIFTFTSGGKLWRPYNVGILFESVCVYGIIALGAMFVYALGSMDVSIGAQLGVYCILMIFIINATGSPVLAFAAVLAIALLCGAINGAVSVFLGLPSIVTSLVLMFIFGGVQLLLMEGTGTNAVSSDYDFSALLNPWFIAGTLAVMLALATYFFNFSKLGKYVRAIGANETATRQSGVNTTKYKVLAFMALGVCVSIGTVYMLARTGSAGKGTGAGYAMDVMLSLILGGMPLAGGMKAKVRSALLGTFTYVLLSNGLTLSGVDVTLIHLIKALIFVVVILLTCRDRGTLLPR